VFHSECRKYSEHRVDDKGEVTIVDDAKITQQEIFQRQNHLKRQIKFNNYPGTIDYNILTNEDTSKENPY